MGRAELLGALLEGQCIWEWVAIRLGIRRGTALSAGQIQTGRMDCELAAETF